MAMPVAQQGNAAALAGRAAREKKMRQTTHFHLSPLIVDLIKFAA
jgi:hypothetical protein